MRVLKYALVGWEVEESTIDDNLSRAETHIAHAKENGADAIGFVEYFSILGTPVKPAEAAEEPTGGKVTRWAVEVSNRHGIEIWCPFIELDSQNGKYNSVAIVDPLEGIVDIHREFHFYTLEQKGLSVGTEIKATKRPWGILGCFICFDIHYPEVSRILAMQGAEVVFWPSLSVGPWSIEAVRKKACVRCMDNGFWLIESNLASAPPYAPYAGKSNPGSCIYDPEGNIIASTGYRPGTVFVEIDLDRGSYGKGIFGAEPQEDLRAGFQDWLRPDYYAEAYSNISRRSS